MFKKSDQKGFTLIELMIVVVVIGILAGVAFPSYQEHVRKSKRSTAAGDLMGLAAALERSYTANGDYCDVGSSTNSCGDAGSDEGAPASSLYPSTSPSDGSEAFYNLTIHDATTNTYEVRAAPTGGQSGDKCGTFTLTNTGTRGLTGQSSGVTVSDCWD